MSTELKAVTITDDNKSDPGMGLEVTLDFPRVKGTLKTFVMASPSHVRFQGILTINGATVHYSGSPECANPKVGRYELTKTGWITDPATDKAFQQLGALLPRLVEFVTSVPEFQTQQRKTAVKYLGWEIESDLKEITELEGKVEELSKGIQLKQDQMQDMKYDTGRAI